MIPFLQQVAKVFYDRYGSDIYRLAFVFPNKRSGLFFRNYLSLLAENPLFLPEILTIKELFQQINPVRQADRIKLLFILYDIYIRKSGSNETFDDFFHWGEMLLNDFDDVDKCLVDARQLFTNVTDIDSIERDFSFLKPEQIAAVRAFWSSFNPGSEDANRQFFRRIWQILYDIYAEFRRTLSSLGVAGEGMLYRGAIDRIKEETVDFPYEKIVFTGLNALSAAETELLKYLKKRGIADFCWDYASPFLQESENRASCFMHENLRLFPPAFEAGNDGTDTRFETVGIPSRIGQAKHLHFILDALAADNQLNETNAIQTAVVLPDEQMLMPVLHSIPAAVRHINVTLGYSVSGSPVASLMDYLQSLRKNCRTSPDGMTFYYKDVLSILQHSYISSACHEISSAIVRNIVERNQVYVPVSAFAHSSLLKRLFSVPATAVEIPDYLNGILDELLTGMDSADGMTQQPPHASAALEKEFIIHYRNIIKRFQATAAETQTSFSPETCFKLLKQMTGLIKIPFSGEPLSGLQIMGLLETRALDFRNVVILNVNEGVFPAKNAYTSFIPTRLRRAFGLPSQEERESVRAYHFYRLIHRAERVIMLYDTRTEGLQSGEASRFVHQLRYHYKIPVQQKLAVYGISPSRLRPFMIEKDDDAMQLLSLYGTEKRLSATAINTYLDCPVKFYFSVLKGIREEDRVSETVESDVFGTILHSVMEISYSRLCGAQVTADALKILSEESVMTAAVQQAFARDFFHTSLPRPLTGQTFLYGETVRKYAARILEYDMSLTPFMYVASEKPVRTQIEIANGFNVKIKGFIDRLDSRDGILRIVDYKSGKSAPPVFHSVESLFDVDAKDRKKAVMQVFLYAWAYTPLNTAERIQPALYYIRNLFVRDGFDPSVFRVAGRDRSAVNDFSPYFNEFEDSLRATLGDIFDASQPFLQTRNVRNCRYCPFADICGKA